MAVRRKYKSPPYYRDGGAVPLAAEIVAEPMMAEPMLAAPAAGSPTGSSPASASPASATDAAPQTEADSAVMEAVRAQLHAEGLHREVMRHRREMAMQQAAPPAPAPTPSSVEQYVDTLPGLSVHKRNFLKANPSMLEPAQSNSLAQHYSDAIRAGLKDDSAELDQYVLQGVQRDMDALSHRRQSVFEAELPPRSPAPQRRRSMPVSAPVSRDVPMASGQRQTSSSITLRPEEVEMAHLSYRDLPQVEAERLYALQKMKLSREREAGRHPERERG